MEVPQRLTIVLFDKTGTLTTGRPEVTDVVEAGAGRAEILSLAGAAEAHSPHPLAQAVVRAAQGEGLTLAENKEVETYPGQGIAATVEGKRVLVGNRALFQAQGVSWTPELEEAASALEEQGKSVAGVALDGALAGLLGIADRLKETTPEAVAALHKMGLKTAMITGDNEKTARAVAAKAGIKEVLAQVLPGRKAEEVKRLQQGGQVVAFVGDGINDAPALAQADVGLALGGGTDVAMESGDVVLMKDDLRDAVAAIQLSAKVMTRIKQNLFWAFAYNTALIPLAAGVLHPAFGLTFRPELAGLAMAMSSVTVVTLSLTLKGFVPGIKRPA